MFTSVRAGLAAALIALAVIPAIAADKAFKRSDLDDAAIKLEAQIKSDAGTVTKPAATLRRDADAAFQKNDFRTGMTGARPARHRGADRCNELAAPVAHRAADPPARRQRARAAARSRLHRRLYRLSARERPQSGSRQPGGARPHARRPQAMAPGARCHAAGARSARDRRPARPIRTLAHRARLPVPGLFGRLRRCFTPRVLPVLRGIARPAHRFLALRGGRRPGQAGDLGQRQAALRRRPQARRTLRHHAARRPAVGGAGRRWRNRPTSPSSCATASRSCAFPARPMCCRAPASAAFRCSASTPARSCCRSIASATAICSTPCSATISSATCAPTRPSGWPTSAAPRCGAAN